MVVAALHMDFAVDRVVAMVVLLLACTGLAFAWVDAMVVVALLLVVAAACMGLECEMLLVGPGVVAMVVLVVVVAKMVVVVSVVMVVALRQTRFWMEGKAFLGLSAAGLKEN